LGISLAGQNSRMRILTYWAFLALAAVSPLNAAREDPVQWSLTPIPASAQVAPGSKAYLELKATIEPGWHLYSPTTPAGGPIITLIGLRPNPVIASYEVYRPQPVRKLDPNFQLETETYTGSAAFLIEAVTGQTANGKSAIEATARYQACSDTKCLNPVRKTATADINFSASARAASFTIPAGYAPVVTQKPPSQPRVGSASQAPRPASAANEPLLPFLLTAFGFGLAALFTPCVFPMIPITVSFFLNQSTTRTETPRRKGWTQALVFCVGIVVLFTGLGLLVTLIAGPFGVVQLGSNPWVNAFIALVFCVFALSLLGAFELRLPSGVLTKLDRVSQGGGYAGTMLMGLTFSLTSFACIGPIVGPLLIATVQSKGLLPVLGMLSFATGLAAPFFLLALFPSYLTNLPRSGGLLVRVKIALGFVALSVTF